MFKPTEGSTHLDAADAIAPELARDFALNWVEDRIGGNERRQVIVLATQLSVRCNNAPGADAEAQLATTLSAKQSIIQTITALGGRVIQRSGGAILAAWGVPVTLQDDASQAVRAALRIVDTIPGQYLVTAAVEAGLVVTGSARASTSSHLDIDGPAFDTVLQALAHAQPGEILATETAASLFRGAFDTAPLAVTSAPEGAATDLATAPRLVRVLGPSRPDAAFPAQSVGLVGHEIARHEIATCLDGAQRGIGSAVLLRGEAGLGKTGLIRAARADYQASAGLWIESICRHETRHSPLYPIRAALRHVLVETVSAQTAGHIARITVRLGADRWASIARFLGATSGPDRLDPRHGHRLEQRPMDIMLEALGVLAEAGPLVLVVEDLHWSDSATWEFVSRVAASLDSRPGLALILTSRDDLSPLVQRKLPVASIVLQRLFRDQIAAIVAASPEGQRLSTADHAWIAERSEGVPLYALELTRLRAAGVTEVETAGLLEGPSGLNAILAARLDQLGDLKRMAQAASIFGRQFDRAALAALMDASPTQLGPALHGLVEFGILEAETASADLGYRFTHSLLRDAAYATLMRGKRRQLHAKAAAILAERMRANGTGRPEQIAAHFIEAGDRRNAFTWWRIAGEAAVAISENRGSLSLLEAAIEAARIDPDAATLSERVGVHRLLALQYSLVKGNAAGEVIDAYQRCLDLSERDETIARAASFDILWGLHTCYLVRGEMRDALDIGTRLLATCDEHGSDSQKLLADRIHALSLLLAGDPTQALHYYDRVLARYRASDHEPLRFAFGSDQRALALAHSAWALTVLGRVDEAHASAKAAQRAIVALNHPHTTAHVVCILATAAQTAGERRSAAAMAAAGRVVAEKHGFNYWVAWADMVLGWLEATTDPDRGLTMIADAIEAYRGTGASQAIPYAKMLYADVALIAGRPKIAHATLERAIEFAETRGLTLYAPELERLMAHALMAGRVGGTAARGRAEAAAERALDLALAHNSQLFATRARATFEQLFTPTSATSPGQPAAANGVPRAVADVRRNRA